MHFYQKKVETIYWGSLYIFPDFCMNYDALFICDADYISIIIVNIPYGQNVYACRIYSYVYCIVEMYECEADMRGFVNTILS